MPTPGQQSLRNFYASVAYSNPLLAATMSEDVMTVGLNALADDKSQGQAAANSLREKARDLPEVLRRVLDNALTELGYSEPGRVPADQVLSHQKQIEMAQALKAQGHQNSKIAYVMRIDESSVRDLLA